MNPELRNLLYLAASILFILGIKGLTRPRTAVRGNLLGACGMLLAIVVTLVDREIIHWIWIAVGLLAGTGIGLFLALRVAMTGMPQLVAAYNGFGGCASLLVAGAALHEAWADQAALGAEGPPTWTVSTLLAIVVSGLVGSVTASGSAIAFGKLQEYWFLDRLVAPGHKMLNAALAIAVLLIGVAAFTGGGAPWSYWLLVLVALVLGVTLTTPIGGADMPVVVSLLNSYSGLAAAATGFVLGNNVLVIAGSLVGASGLILTRIMCVAMNRSLTNVLFGVMAEAGSGPTADEVYAGKVKSTSPEEVAMLLESARRVMIVPGYGMAVAQAQHVVRDLMQTFERKTGGKVEFAIHPVAGRMPGHMNVLLAEADIPYDRLLEMEAANAEMESIDVAIVIGANDVVNPVARDPGSPIAGMPIIDVDRASTVVVVKRSLSPGFAGIPNPLFAAPNALMLFGDGKKAMLELVKAIEEG